MSFLPTVEWVEQFTVQKSRFLCHMSFTCSSAYPGCRTSSRQCHPQHIPQSILAVPASSWPDWSSHRHWGMLQPRSASRPGGWWCPESTQPANQGRQQRDDRAMSSKSPNSHSQSPKGSGDTAMFFELHLKPFPSYFLSGKTSLNSSKCLDVLWFSYSILLPFILLDSF